MEGVSLIETLVVIGIIAILSLFSINTINNFRKDALLENTATEFVSTIREARSKSMNGELLLGENALFFTETGLPEYGIAVTAASYQVVRQCMRNDGSNCADEPPVASVPIGSEYVMSPEGSFYFKRISGDTAGKEIEVREKTGTQGRRITITPDFVITVSKL